MTQGFERLKFAEIQPELAEGEDMFRCDNHSDRSRGQRDESLLTATARIVAMQGGDSHVIQGLLDSVAHQWSAAGARVVGVVEEIQPGRRKGDGGAVLRNVRSGALYELYQDLGPHSSACCLNPGGIAEACQAVIEDLEGCDVVVLSKFGKLEAERSGLLDAFIEAASLNKPVLTAVSPNFTAPYLAFAGPWGALAPVDKAYLHDWARRTIGSPIAVGTDVRPPQSYEIW